MLGGSFLKYVQTTTATVQAEAVVADTLNFRGAPGQTNAPM